MSKPSRARREARDLKAAPEYRRCPLTRDLEEFTGHAYPAGIAFMPDTEWAEADASIWADQPYTQAP